MARFRAVTLLACLTLAATACGGAAETTAVDTPTADAAAPAVTDTTSETTAALSEAAPTPAAADVTAFCDALVQAEMMSARGPDIDFEKASPEEIEKAVGSFAEELTPMLDAMMAEVPDEVADEAATLDRLLRKALESGDDSVFEQEEFTQADRTVDEFVLDRCDYQSVDIQAVEYAYDGVPQTVQAGTVGIDFSNAGAELHEMALFRLNDGVTESVEELLQMPEEKALKKVTEAGHAFAFPGTADITFIDLEPGNYAMACFVPVGTTPDKLEALESGSEPGGPPHFTEGMFAEFTVEG